MKKPIRLFTAFLAVLSLSACENLGEKIDYNEGVRKQAQYEAKAEDHLPTVNGYNTTYSMKVSASGQTLSSTGKGTTSYDLDSVYYHSKATASASYGGQSASQTQDQYAFFNGGYFYNISKTDNSAWSIQKSQMTKAEAKAYLIDNYIAATVDLSSLSEGTIATPDTKDEKSLYAYYTSLFDAKQTTYYSKGEGNLSFKTKFTYTSKGTTSIPFTFTMSGTFDNYVMTKVSLTGKFSQSGASASINLSAKATFKCSVSYPNVSGLTFDK